jgi:hypothetical protein
MQCTSPWLDHCFNYPLRCDSCRAGLGQPNGPLLYLSHDGPTKQSHPSFKSSSKLKPKSDTLKAAEHRLRSRQTKNGFKQEDLLLKKTIRSGAVLNDGDLHVKSLDLRIDSKLRHTDSLTFTLKSSEFKQGLLASIDAWILTHQHSNGSQTSLVCCSFDTFHSLLQLARDYYDSTSSSTTNR